MCAVLAFSCAVALLLGEPARALAAGPCSGKVMYVAAHEDDTLLFQSPQLLEDVKANKCVMTVFTTAGDAGKSGTAYWEGREAGAEAGYAEMAGVLSTTWTGSSIVANGHTIHLETLTEQPGLTIAYLRLPDGGPDGKGFPSHGEQSLTKLWRDGHGEVPAISSITPVDGAASYSYEGLVKTLTALMTSFAPERIETQNYAAPGLVGLDHSDHIATGKFTQVAQLAYAPAHLLRGYQGYENYIPPLAEEGPNVEGEQLTAKQNAFLAYVPHDEACGTDEDCGVSPYPQWLERQYVAATESTPGANAGPDQSVPSASSVQLDGSASFDPGGGGLTYAWTQTSGPGVTLSNATAQKPTFTAPAGPTTLKFSLKVDSGPRESLADSVTIAVEKPTAAPNFTSADATEFTTGVSGEFTITTSGEPTPTITKAAGTIPAGLSFEDKGDGTAVLSGKPDASAAEPGESREYPIELKAQNSAGSKLQALTVTVTNPGTKPNFTSAASTSFTVGTNGEFTITTSGAPAPAISKTSGTVPPGLTLVDKGNGTAVLSGKPEQSAAPLGGSQEYSIGLEAKNKAGSKPQTLTVTVSNPNLAPKFASGTSASFTTGTAGSFTVSTSGNPPAAITKTAGSLPPGLSLTDNGDGSAKISGTPTAAAANPGTSQPYPLTLKAKNSVGEVSQELTLTVTSPPPNNGGGGGGGGENPPPKENIVVKLSKAKVKLVVGRKSKHLVKVIAPQKSAVKCRGQLPKGARCKVTAQRDVLIESSKSVKAAGTYHLVIDFAWQQGSSQRPLTVVFKRPGR
ncbi:MAG TPA: PIG-L family deacetylase [Solirubrobacterales bacterium]|nr:PIG-L family deacetylase [Solirubrobacterales bacterium]